MDEQFLETIIMPMILHAGNAKSLSMEAIALAKKGDFDSANKHMDEAMQALTEAHHIQTQLLQQEAQGDMKQVSIFLIHSQDHLMTSMAVKDLAAEFIELYKRLEG